MVIKNNNNSNLRSELGRTLPKDVVDKLNRLRQG